MSSARSSLFTTRYEPGTNLRRRFPRAGWLYLLPRLELTGVLFIGVPRKETLTALARRTQRIAVACAGRRDFRARAGIEGEPGFERVEWLDSPAQIVPEAPDWADLVVFVGRRSRRWMAEVRGGREVVRRITDRGGVAYLEYFGLGTRTANRKREWGSLQDLGAFRAIRLLPLWGEIQAAVPEGDRGMLDYLLGRGLAHPWLWSGLPARIKKVWRWVPVRRSFGSRCGVLLGGSKSQRDGQPPEYLCAVARGSGVALEEYRWGLSIPDAYQSRKLIFHLIGPHPSYPSYVAKMVSDPSFNGRLENEAHALRQLEALGMADGKRIPRVVFSGKHAGLVLVGESMIEGVPFQKKSDGSPVCPYAGAAIETLLDLGRASRHVATATGPALASELGRLLSRFRETYRDDDVASFVQRQLESLERHPKPIPLVFQHGDPGSWNFLVASTGGVGLLDWEAAEPAGLPLWDLLHFLRSYGVLRARRRGIHVSIRAFELAFLVDSELARWGRRSVARYCQTLGLAPCLVEPLFYSCWMHRSVKEAARLEPRKLNRGLYVNLLRRCVRDRSRESLAPLFALSGE